MASLPDMSTDLAWEEWGRRDPYFGVITDPKFRREAMTAESRNEFFGRTEAHVTYVMQMARHCAGSDFTPKKVLEFGCGVGRLLPAFAKIAQEVVAVDVSPSMLQEARLNCDAFGLANVRLLLSDDKLSTLDTGFDLIHSFITFQHIPTVRGKAIFRGLLRRLEPGGIGAIHVSYAKLRFEENDGVEPRREETGRRTTPGSTAGADPEMQMNSYSLNELFFILQRDGVRRIEVDFIDHGGELGVFLFFQRPIP